MFRLRHVLAMAARLVTLTCGVAAVAVLLRPHPAPQIGHLTPAPLAVPAVSAATAETQPPHGWSLGTDGWVIRVDGAEVAIPSFDEQTRSRPRASVGMSISPFDQIIVTHATAQGFDWRLIAALIFEESRFDPNSESDKGAYGLMQVRPIAAAEVGETNFYSPDDNVRTGVRYLAELEQMFRDVNAADRLSFVLAAYHMGPAHVHDAQQLARKLGFDAARWDAGVGLILPLLEEPNIYKDLPTGYAQGRLTAAYVQHILERYERYLRGTA